MHKFFAFFAVLIPLALSGQSTANDIVPPYKGQFGYGANMGYFPPHYYDIELATLAHGTPDGKVPGYGITSIRPGLFGFFLEEWGYDIRKDAFKYYRDIGIQNVVAIIGFPGEKSRENAYYCPGQRSEMYKGLYEPIWDNGENGTPVNDDNTYALYVWNMVSQYKDDVRFWEVWNEPDVDTGNGWKPAGMDGNWWENAPGPCETKLKAPIYYYVRTLRITYEVVKRLNPDDYVCVGGLGWPSYLDAILRHTDNPFDGTATSLYPKKGGAYFDCMSFHSYPHIDNSLREWSNDINDFKYFRHSDRAVDGVFNLKNKFNNVLKKHGYGDAYPEKVWICSEFNVPRRQFGDYMGSDAGQVNFMIKTLVKAQMENVVQMHVYSLADEKPERHATNEFSFMGLFKNLEGVLPYAGEANAVAWAIKTTQQLLGNSTYNPTQTARLNLPPNIRGGVFTDNLGQHTFVLWAVTDQDRDETATAEYHIPDNFNLKYVDLKSWQYSHDGLHQLVNAKQVPLTGSPVFITGTRVTNEFPKQPSIKPNPAPNGVAVLEFWMFEEGWAEVDVFNMHGQRIKTVVAREQLISGPHSRIVDLSNYANGTYVVNLRTQGSNQSVRMVKY